MRPPPSVPDTPIPDRKINMSWGTGVLCYQKGRGKNSQPSEQNRKKDIDEKITTYGKISAYKLYIIAIARNLCCY